MTERSRKDELDDRLKLLKSGCETTATDLGAKRRKMKSGRKELKEANEKLSRAKQDLEEYLMTYERILKQTSSLTDELNLQMKKSEKVAEATKAIEKEIEEKKFELTLVQKEARNLQKLAKAANKRIAKYDAEKDKADAKRLKLSALVSSSSRTSRRRGHPAKRRRSSWETSSVSVRSCPRMLLQRMSVRERFLTSCAYSRIQSEI